MSSPCSVPAKAWSVTAHKQEGMRRVVWALRRATTLTKLPPAKSVVSKGQLFIIWASEACWEDGRSRRAYSS
jgi:hypothetical protein